MSTKRVSPLKAVERQFEKIFSKLDEAYRIGESAADLIAEMIRREAAAK